MRISGVQSMFYNCKYKYNIMLNNSETARLTRKGTNMAQNAHKAYAIFYILDQVKVPICLLYVPKDQLHAKVNLEVIHQ